MKRGRTERETCDLNGWGVGTVLRGHEAWGSGDGFLTTIRITALGESMVLARPVSQQRTYASKPPEPPIEEVGRENAWTLAARDWVEVTTYLDARRQLAGHDNHSEEGATDD